MAARHTFLVITCCFPGDVLCIEVRLAEGAVGKEDDIFGVLVPDFGGCSHKTRF